MEEIMNLVQSIIDNAELIRDYGEECGRDYIKDNLDDIQQAIIEIRMEIIKED